MRGGGWLILASSILIGALNYGYTVAMVHLLSPGDFSQVATISSLLLVVGTAAAAMMPRVLARQIANAGDVAGRRRAVGFALTASVSAGAVTALLLCLAEAGYASPTLMAVSALTSLAIFVAAAGAGYLQGTRQFRRLAVFRSAEVVVKVLLGVGAVALTRSPEAGIAGFAAGSVFCAGWALWLMRHDLGLPRRGTFGDRELWRHTAGIGAVQSMATLLLSLDVVVLSLTVGTGSEVAGYQGMLILGRIPLYLSVALATVTFPRLAARDVTPAEVRLVVRRSLTTYLVLGSVMVGALVLVPRRILSLILPVAYLDSHMLLLPLALGGLAAGLLNLVATFHQASARYRPAALLLTGAVVVGGGVLTAVSDDLTLVAWATTAVLLLASLAGLALLPRGKDEWRAGATDPADVLGRAVRHATRRRGGRPARMVLLGNYGNGNTGDESILSGLLSLTDAPDTITVVSRNPEQLARLHGVDAAPTVSGRSLRAFLTADAVGIGGGGMFGHGLPPLVRVLPWVAVAARLLGKEVYFLSLGAYRTTPANTRIPLQLAARLATAITVRDPESRATMSGGISRREVYVVPDPSTMVPPAAEARVRELTGETGRPLLISVKAMPDLVELDRLLAEVGRAVAGWAATHDNPIYVVSMSTAGDYGLGTDFSDARLGERLIEHGGLAGRVRVLGPDLHPSLAKGLHARAAGVIAMRLHSQIFATSTGAPLLGLSFEPKSRLWLAENGGDELDTGAVTEAAVRGWLHSLEPAEVRG
ncbi:polysaccharide pyruvyl transferase family protein [Actinoplanes rectilineatus]|uniref:polysaccharide pyruvyl transferase family protein n=1 Tax=Actinoplanes rectilineatus TaxID=113571 RepID=UPI0005F2AB61|nr:polysaccharide pyruvyl transferase family protein [Actinoplanes rectilineatus]